MEKNSSAWKNYKDSLPSTKGSRPFLWFYSGILLLGFSLGVLVTAGVDMLSRSEEKGEAEVAEISDSDMCYDQGGRYDTREEKCILSAADEGEECASNEDCEGWCIATVSAEVGSEEKGSCSKTFNVEGCVKFIDNGFVNEVCLP